jgi:filamentous hemagglutinin
MLDEKCVKHLFRNSEGHFFIDTPRNRQLLLETASDPKNYIDIDMHGNHWFAKILNDGTQVWVQVRGEKICYGGLNTIPKMNFDPGTGLCRSIRPGE